MSDHFPYYYQKNSWLNVCSHQNVLTHTPFDFNGYGYPTNPSSVINGRVQYVANHCQQTNNLHTGIWDRDTYFRFHGGIGDGRGGIACWNTYENVVARPVQLFDALNMVDFQVNVPKKPPVSLMEAMGGTGVFLPVYPKKNCATKGNRVRGGRRGRMNGKDISNKPSMSSDAVIVKEEEPKDIDEIPIELLLPAEWTY